MKRFIASTLLLACIPSSASAVVMTSANSATASSGGVTAESGEVVVTSNTSAKSQVHTSVVGGPSGTDVRIEVVAEKDGKEFREVKEEHYEAGEAVSIVVSTTTAAVAKTKSPATTSASTTKAASTTAKALSTESILQALLELPGGLLAEVQAIFARVGLFLSLW